MTPAASVRNSGGRTPRPVKMMLALMGAVQGRSLAWWGRTANGYLDAVAQYLPDALNAHFAAGAAVEQRLCIWCLTWWLIVAINWAAIGSGADSFANRAAALYAAVPQRYVEQLYIRGQAINIKPEDQTGGSTFCLFQRVQVRKETPEFHVSARGATLPRRRHYMMLSNAFHPLSILKCPGELKRWEKSLMSAVSMQKRIYWWNHVREKAKFQAASLIRPKVLLRWNHTKY